MCYRCEICETVVEAGIPQHKYVTYKEGVPPFNRLCISKEWKVCAKCKENLLGFPLAMLLKQHGRVKQIGGEGAATPVQVKVQPTTKPEPKRSKVLKAVELELEVEGVNGKSRPKSRNRK